MVEQQTLEGLLAKEDQLGQSIAKRQQQLTNLNTGGDGSPMNLARADSLVSSGILTTRIAQLEQRQLRIGQRIDTEILPMAYEYVADLRTQERQLQRVQRHRAYLPDLTNEDMALLEGEYVEYTRRSDHNPVLARAMEALKRQEQAKQDKSANLTEPPPITYALVEERVRLTDEQRELLQILLPNHISEENAISGPDWCNVLWPNIPRDKALKRLGAHLSRIRRKLPGTGLSIPIVKPDKSGRGSKYYLDIGPVPEIAKPPAPTTASVQAAPTEDNFQIQTLITSVREKRLRRLPNQVLANMRNTDPEILTVLANYLQSQDIYPLLNACVHFKTALRGMSEGEPRKDFENRFYRHASGHVNEWLFYRIFYPEYLQQGLYLLSPLQKQVVYRNVYLDKRTVPDDTFGLNPEIEGVPSPDSLIIKPLPPEEPEFLEVVSVVECKAVTRPSSNVQSYIEHQRIGYTANNVAYHLKLNGTHPAMPTRLGRLLNRLNSDLPALPLRVSEDMTVVYAAPQGIQPLHIKNVQPFEETFQEIPITTNAIAGFLRELTRAL